jgi:hypothetical protein
MAEVTRTPVAVNMKPTRSPRRPFQRAKVPLNHRALLKRKPIPATIRIEETTEGRAPSDIWSVIPAFCCGASRYS